MKITHSELVQIIKEEVESYKKVKLLENRRREIIRQLNEIANCSECGRPMEESDDNMEEIFGLFKKKGVDPKKVEIMKKFIQKHPTHSAAVERFAKQEGVSEEDMLTKMATFFAQEGDIIDNKLKGVLSYKYENGDFINTTKVSVPYGPMSGKGQN